MDVVKSLPNFITVPSAPVIKFYAVVPIYNQLSELNEVIVQWEEVLVSSYS